MTQPVDLPVWDENETNSVEPAQSRQDDGWQAPGGVPEKPPFQYFNWWQNNVYKWIKHFSEEGMPAGAELFWATDSPPDGWLEEDGSEISRVTYADLFAAIGTDYGIGDGSTTFNLPDPQGMAIRVWDHGAGVDPDSGTRTDRGDGTTGDNVGTNQLGELENHSHQLYQTNTKTTAGPTADVGQGATTISASFTLTTGGNETRMINTNRMLIIKY